MSCYDMPPNEFATSMAQSEAGNVIGYCRILLADGNAKTLAATKTGITPARVKSLLVRATGLAHLSAEKTKALAKAKHAEKYGG